jgi:tetratricopeptide (TPR) repeat protein
MPKGTGGRHRFPRGQAIDPAALRKARHDAGLTLAETAEGIISRQALQQFEAGKARPMPGTLQAIARRLNVTVDALLARPRDPRELEMRNLEEKQRWRELERLAVKVLGDLNVTPRTQAVARFYLGRAALNEAPEEALDHLREARGPLAKYGEPWLAAEALDWEAAALYLMQRPEALEVGQDALARYRVLTNRDPQVEARMLEHIGTYQLQRQELADAMQSYLRAIDVAGNVLNLVRLANIYHGLGSACLRLRQSRRALEYFERAVHFGRTHQDVTGTPIANLARLENDYGDMLVRAGNLKRAEEMIRSALDRYEAGGIDAARSDAMLSMGLLRQHQGQTDDAMRWTNDAMKLAQRLGETVSLAAGYQQLGELWAAQGDRERFEAAFSRAIELHKRAGLPERLALTLERYRRVRESTIESEPPGG